MLRLTRRCNPITVANGWPFLICVSLLPLLKVILNIFCSYWLLKKSPEAPSWSKNWGHLLLFLFTRRYKTILVAPCRNYMVIMYNNNLLFTAPKSLEHLQGHKDALVLPPTHNMKTLHQWPVFSLFQIAIHTHKQLPPIHSQTLLHFTSTHPHPSALSLTPCMWMCVVRALFALLVGTATTVGGTGTTSAGATNTQAAGAGSSSRQQQIQLSDLQNILSSMNGQSAQFLGQGLFQLMVFSVGDHFCVQIIMVMDSLWRLIS